MDITVMLLGASAGQRELQIHVSSRESVKDFELATLNLLVGSFEDLRIRVDPLTVTAGSGPCSPSSSKTPAMPLFWSHSSGPTTRRHLAIASIPSPFGSSRGDAEHSLRQSPADVHGSAPRCRAR